MPVLLPASAAAFKPRSAPTIVLNGRVESWMTQTLKRINRIKRPLNSVQQHFRCLTETLGGPNAIWTLCSIMVPKAPDAELRKDDNLLVEALFNYQLIHVEAYVVHVDTVSQNEVAFKLTQDTIDSLIDYHKEIYCVDIAAATYNWAEKEVQIRKLQEEFVQAVNRYVYRTHVRALEGLEDDGAGELLEGRSQEVKDAIISLFQPLLPPPPKIVDFVPNPIPSSHPQTAQWWQPNHYAAQYHHLSASDSWRVLGSTPSPTVTAGDSLSSSWSQAGLNETHLPSPTPSISQPYTSSGSLYNATQSMSAPPSLSLPSPFSQQCGPASGTGYNAFAFSFNDFPSQYPIHT